jgi:soluble cytochrome b562
VSEKLDLKSAIEVAVSKEIDAPDEVSGLVLHTFGHTFKQEAELNEKKASTEKDLAPSAEEMQMINASAPIEQDPENWYVFRKVNVTGPLQEVDSHGDVFTLQAAKTMASQVTPYEASPIITDHWHDLGDRPPVGKAISAKATNRGLLETWAIPKEDYNAPIVKGILNGTVNKISIGAFIDPKDKICNSCGTKSIYDSSCPHIPNRKDEKGELTTVTIKDIKRYAERSLVNIPARKGTGVLAPMAQESGFKSDSLLDINLQLSPASVEKLSKVMEELGQDSEIAESQSAPEDTIPPVINEDSIVAEKEVQEQEAPAVEETTEVVEEAGATAPEEVQEEVKSVEVPVVKEIELEVLTKSFAESLNLEATNKAVAETNEKISKFLEAQEKQAEDIQTVKDVLKALIETVDKAVKLSNEETLEKILEVASQLKDSVEAQKAAAPKLPTNMNDMVDLLAKRS